MNSSLYETHCGMCGYGEIYCQRCTNNTWDKKPHLRDVDTEDILKASKEDKTNVLY